MADKACNDCNRIVEDSTECPVCKSNDLSSNYSGLVAIYNPEDSKIAEKLGVSTPGRYAVRTR